MVSKSPEKMMSGAEKAAILMLALGEEQCAKLFEMMHEEEIKEISFAMTRLGSISAEVVEGLCNDFTQNLGSASMLVGSFDSTERLLQKSLSRERANQIMEEIVVRQAVLCGTSLVTSTRRFSPII